MHIVVCIKQVPDSAHIRVHPVTHTVMRQGVPAIINPYDLFAIEAALRLKDQLGGRVTVMSMGPAQAELALRKAIALGCDEAILVTDRIFAGADTLATSYVLASAIRTLNKELPVDLVFTGKQTIDGDTAQVGPGIARRLDMQLLTYVSRIVRIDPERRRIVVERRAERGTQVLETAMPALVTLLEGSNEIRFATTPNMFRAARAAIRTWDRNAAGIEDIRRVGLKGSPTIVSRVFAPVSRAEKAKPVFFDPDDPDGSAVSLLDQLVNEMPTVRKELEHRRSYPE